MPIFCDYFSDRQIFHWRRDITRGVEKLVGLKCSHSNASCFEIINFIADHNLSYLDPEYDFWKFSFPDFSMVKPLYLVWQDGMQNTEFTTDKLFQKTNFRTR